MFFPLSKILGFFAIPSNLVVSIGILGLLLLPTRFARAGRALAFASLIVLAILGLSPAGNALIIPLEERFRGARRSGTQRGGRTPDGGGRTGAALSRRPHRVFGRQRRADLRRGRGGALRAPPARGPWRCARAHRAGGSVSQYGRERGPFQGRRPAQAGRALAAGDVGPSSAAGGRRLPQGRLSRRSLPGRLAHARSRRRAAPVREPRRRAAANRHRRARMGRTCGLLAHGAQLGALSGTDARPPLKKSSSVTRHSWRCIYPLFTARAQTSRALDTTL